VEEILIASGIGIIIAAIVGGGLKAGGIEIPVINSYPRQVVLGILGAILLFLGIQSSTPTPPETGPPITSTATHTSTATYTATPTFTTTHAATSTPITPTPTPSPPKFTADQPSHCREGPRIDYNHLAYLNEGETALILAKSPVSWGVWWVVSTEAGVLCWIWGELGSTSGDLNSVRVIPAPPTPTPKPTRPSTATPEPSFTPKPTLTPTPN